mmetsp:Transcript_36/g.84  ORF Transcript_36/g.84 Transcript_36/m.84 type:complete len:110 (-) Transcript_36:264-593(-)
MKFLAFALACLAVLAQVASALSLRGSAFVPSVMPCRPETAMMGSLQNAPNHAGKILGIPVGTAKQRKQAKIKIDAAHAAEVKANKERKEALTAKRAARAASGEANSEDK